MKESLPLFESGDSRDIAKRHCRSIGISITVLEDLIRAEMEQVGKLKKLGLWDTFDGLLVSEESE